MGSAARAAGSVSAALAWVHANIWAGGKLLGTYDALGLHFYLDDPLPGVPSDRSSSLGWLGTRRAQTDAAGTLEQACASLPYGDSLACSGGNLQAPTEHHFTGKERDSESGNDYFGARYYASFMGRFMSPDWAAKAEPVPYAKMNDPQSLNLYAYVGNNPMSNVDADGHLYGSPSAGGDPDSLDGEYYRETMLADYFQAHGATEVNKGQSAAQQQDATARREQAAEQQALANMDKYKKNGAMPGVKMVANCAAGNHDCTYRVSGTKGTVYVWEHQTQGGGGRDHRGTGDNTSGGDFKNKFPDEITGQVDSYRFFTISTSQNYDPAKQILVPIQENGEMRGYEHMFNNDYGTGPLYISGHTQLTP